jgi:putative copper export protein
MLRLSALLVLTNHLLTERLSTPRRAREADRRQDGSFSAELLVWVVVLIGAATFGGLAIMAYIRARAAEMGG